MGCHTCQVACKEKNNLPAGQRWRRVVEFTEGDWRHEQGAVRHEVHAWYLSISCNHCLSPACVDNCPTGALRPRNADGLVLLDPQQCIGCAYCVWSCPYGAPQYDPARGKVGKCDACVDRLNEGLQPACVDACPVRALSFGPWDVSPEPARWRPARGLPSHDLTQPSLAVRPHRDATAQGKP
jgi:anaerobic dimethyl sulfoxide reductase subunit B